MRKSWKRARASALAALAGTVFACGRQHVVTYYPHKPSDERGASSSAPDTSSRTRGPEMASLAPSTMGASPRTETFGPPVDTSSIVPAAPPPPNVAGREPELFARFLDTHPDLTARQVLDGLPKRPYVDHIDFDPTKAAFYPQVAAALRLTPEEIGVLKRQGLVAVDHAQPYSMAGMYFAIYTRDLPVLITSDSILLALHRSYDTMLRQLELALLLPIFDTAFARVRTVVERRYQAATSAQERQALQDVDLYVTVASNLLQGAGEPQSTSGNAPVGGGQLRVASATGQEAAVLAILQRVAATKADTPGAATRLYGGSRVVDWSQFVPRGHYTDDPLLRRYFRAMMWLGRADLGFHVTPPAADSGSTADVARESRAAAALTLALRESGHLPRVLSASHVIDVMVGATDSVSLVDLDAALTSSGISSFSDLSATPKLSALASALGETAKHRQRIASRILLRQPNSNQPTQSPVVAQMFGQRFVVDSFVLSKVVFDSIVFRRTRPRRGMPSGLDVFAALGNDEAVRLLAPDLERFTYGSNLLAARAVADAYGPGDWGQSIFHEWLGTLRTLDAPPPSGAGFPQAMKTQAWQRKQLQTQLASWAELRRDTILYTSQSYTFGTTCEYPTGYVEPYPEFFDGLEQLGTHAAHAFANLDVSVRGPRSSWDPAQTRDHMVEYWKRLAATSARLSTLARKELSQQPFTTEELRFVKQTINIQFSASGPPRYDGWYPKLFFGREPDKRHPTVADVHTDPNSASMLEVATGDPTFLVAAIDNGADKTVYVGPMSAYYEFGSRQRLDDASWTQRLASSPPARPDWQAPFRAPVVQRNLGEVRR